MNSKTFAFTVTAILSASALFAEPRVDQSAVTLAQDSQSRLVTVGYTLTGEPAVVTVDFQTNTLANAAGDWVSIGDVNFTNVIGDVNQVVQIGSHAIYWQPDKSWPDQRINDGRVRAVVKAWATNAPPDYCAVCLLTDAQMDEKKVADVTWNIPRRRYFVSADAVPGGVTNRLYKTEFLLLRKIPAAGVVWTMQKYTKAGSDKPRKVMLTQDYYIGVFAFTGRQKNAVVNNNTNGGVTPDVNAPWNTVRGTYADYPWPAVGEGYTNYTHNVASTSYLGKLRTRSGIDTFDLPTEAQWEYAARSGHGGWTYNNDNTQQSNVKDAVLNVAWCSDNQRSLHEVGLKLANDWGLYDVLGNVYEAVLDRYATLAEPPSADYVAVDPKGPATGSTTVYRGGHYATAWDWIYLSCRRSESPNKNDGAYGYRVVCDAVAK